MLTLDKNNILVEHGLLYGTSYESSGSKDLLSSTKFQLEFYKSYNHSLLLVELHVYMSYFKAIIEKL